MKRIIKCSVPPRQCGGALLVIVFLLLAMAFGMLLATLPKAKNHDNFATSQLNEAKWGLLNLAFGRQDDPDRHAPPGLLPFPDRRKDGNYDGFSDCPASGTALTHRNRLGLLPRFGEDDGLVDKPGNPHGDRGRGMDICLRHEARGADIAPLDPSNAPIWYAVSANVVFDTLNWDYPTLTISSVLSDTPAYPWLTICGPGGAVISTKAVMVLLAPAAPVGRQDRSAATPGAAAFLDATRLGGNGICGGIQSNSDAPNSTSAAWTFVQAPAATDFNDRLVYIETARYSDLLAARVGDATRRWLDAFHTAFGQFPDAADGSASDSACLAGLHAGRIPLTEGNCTALAGRPLPAAPAWMGTHGDNSGWYRQIGYRKYDNDHASIHFEGCEIVHELSWEGASSHLAKTHAAHCRTG
ncbi:hypothetical protein FNU76_08495 [Chitinimonas arctica]|uniref:Uncharacterized protein n=1 Tax=Chitinimonas arctica TaxID=2594795 RepID=A0A516SEF6_9NEIS|nr:hypothetical protein [Chitinimonas arctica]QDQ26398.1 hypothetical protein FNU76_08495 [Chitinimonas arctica]